MPPCRHTHLILLPESGQRLRCRRCHLTLSAEELQDGFCPECYESSGRRHYDFEPVESTQETRYRCEQCGILIQYRSRQETT